MDGRTRADSPLAPAGSVAARLEGLLREATLAWFISDHAGDTLALRDAAGQTHTLSKSRITKQTPLAASLMPEGLLAGLTDEELRDFLAYLRSTTPPF